MKNGVKMLDIATKLGVSVVTVSNALAGRDGVSEQMRKKICETAEKMGYKPSNTKSERKRIALPKTGKMWVYSPRSALWVQEEHFTGS